MSVEDDILLRIKPDEEEDHKIMETVEKLRELIVQTPAFKEADIELCLVGSIAKGTHLKEPDMDMFLLFDPDVDRATLEKLGIAIGKAAVGGEEHYAEHPYIKGELDGLKTDIVPAYRLGDATQKLTSVDRTPFHTKYVIENSDPAMRDEIRLLKSFMKGTGVYGAEIRTQGFSGYLSELLVIKYGSFLKTLEAVRKWRKHESIHIDTPSPVKFDDALIFIDPVDPRRNVASPVSLDTFSMFVHSADEYLRDPDAHFFFPRAYQELTREEIGQQLGSRADIMAIEFTRPDLIDDVFYGQLKKFEKTMVQLVENNEFHVLHSSSIVNGDDVTMLFELVTAELPKAKAHKGPPVWVHENARDFVQKWKNDEAAISLPYIEDGYWKVIIQRKYTMALDLIRINMTRLDIGKNLNKLKDDLRYTVPDDILEKISTHALSRFLDKRMPWEY